jgi:hypothetical protein
MPSDNDGWSRVERLLGELRAIEYWDTDYWRGPHPEVYEMLAFVARRKRHAEILSRLNHSYSATGCQEKDYVSSGH